LEPPTTASSAGRASHDRRLRRCIGPGFTAPGPGGGTLRDAGCGTGQIAAVVRIPLSATGFTPPGASAGLVFVDAIGTGSAVEFSIPGSNGTLSAVLAAGYPQSAPVSCTAPGTPTSGVPTVSAGPESPTPGDKYSYVWSTDISWRGCRALIVKLVDGTYHRAVFDFGP
jgi:hypothetical protein